MFAFNTSNNNDAMTAHITVVVFLIDFVLKCCRVLAKKMLNYARILPLNS